MTASRLAGLALCLLALAPAAVVACRAGDAAACCRKLGGEWRTLPAPILPTCRIYFEHQGRQRWAHVYLPASFDGVKRFAMWVQLVGVFWNTMDNISGRVGQPLQATDAVPYWDQIVKMFGARAIVVYPQPSGNPGTGNAAADGSDGSKYRQFWNTRFWQCSINTCVDRSVDDVGFLERVMLDLNRRLPVRQGQVLLTGQSAGGAMVHTLLCASRPVAQLVTAAADLLGGLGRDYAASGACSGSPAVPFLKMHGMDDPFLLYAREIAVDGVPFLSAIDTAKFRAAKNGCRGEGAAGAAVTDGQSRCRDFCARAGRPPAKLCGMLDVKHDTDHPWPGYVYQQSWKFFQEVLRARG